MGYPDSANTAGTNGTNGKPLSEAEMGRKIADRLGLPKYDKEADNYHQYTHSTSLCASSEKGCTTDYAATGQSYSAAPGQSGPAKPGEARAIGILGGNHILQFADKNTAVVVNITMPDHVLRDGFVVRWVGERNGEVKIYTYGEGINTNGFTKVLNHAAGWVFKYSDFGIRQQMELKMRETPQ